MTRPFTTLLLVIGTFIISIFLVFDLFIHPGQSASFDAPTHISNIAQVYQALHDGEFPARWGGGFARYGLPIPIIAQQVTSYLGACINFVTHDVVTSYNSVIFIGTVLSVVLMYVFLRLHVSTLPAVAGTLLFHFAPYRIMNVYVRGALPEFFASSWIILILIALYFIVEKKEFKGYLLLCGAVALLLLTHPFMIIVGSFLFIPYTLYLLRHTSKKDWKQLGLRLLVVLGLAGGIAAYYLVPLFIEIRYFYYGRALSHFVPGHFLSLSNFIIESWPYFYNGDIYPRGHVHTGGMIEGIILIAGAVYAFIHWRRARTIELLHMMVLAAGVVIFFTQPVSEILYKILIPLSNIQHPWRMLTAYILIPPIIAALLIEKTDKKKIAITALIIAIAWMRFPQLYGKNYVKFPQESYFLTDYNLHGIVMNTVWMGDERTYPYQKEKIQIIAGTGRIIKPVINNGSRTYTIQASTPVRIVDYTFYFPGWQAYVDGTRVPIQFQDPSYRGVITYEVPGGNHKVYTVFRDTKIRMIGNIITIISGIIFFGAIIRRKTAQQLMTRYL